MRDVGTTGLHHLVCLPTYMERKQERSHGKKQKQMAKNTWNQKKRLKPHPLTHFENKGLRCLFSDHSGAAPKSNTPCCSAKDAVTVQ